MAVLTLSAAFAAMFSAGTFDRAVGQVGNGTCTSGFGGAGGTAFGANGNTTGGAGGDAELINRLRAIGLGFGTSTGIATNSSNPTATGGLGGAATPFALGGTAPGGAGGACTASPTLVNAPVINFGGLSGLSLPFSPAASPITLPFGLGGGTVPVFSGTGTTFGSPVFFGGNQQQQQQQQSGGGDDVVTFVSDPSNATAVASASGQQSATATAIATAGGGSQPVVVHHRSCQQQQQQQQQGGQQQQQQQQSC